MLLGLSYTLVSRQFVYAPAVIEGGWLLQPQLPSPPQATLVLDGSPANAAGRPREALLPCFAMSKAAQSTGVQNLVLASRSACRHLSKDQSRLPSSRIACCDRCGLSVGRDAAVCREGNHGPCKLLEFGW